ncbi:astacin [Ostertagia ostertagi]
MLTNSRLKFSPDIYKFNFFNNSVNARTLNVPKYPFWLLFRSRSNIRCAGAVVGQRLYGIRHDHPRDDACRRILSRAWYEGMRRDNHLEISKHQIGLSLMTSFGKVDLSKTSYYGQPYDYKSILHYDSLAFSKNGFPTMLPQQESATLQHSYMELGVKAGKYLKMHAKIIAYLIDSER